MDPKAMFRLTYGLFLLSAQEDGRDNACIINTAIQVANDPTRISIAVNQGNLTHDMVLRTGVFNISVISTEAEFSLFRHFGMQSGRTVDKFKDFADAVRSANGLYRLSKWSNAWFSLRVTQSVDLGSHTLFIAVIEDAAVLSDAPSCTYGYYQSSIKPKPEASRSAEKVGWRCRICGYVYEGDRLPEDFRCPLCKHGAEDFERIGPAPAPGKFVCSVCGYVHEGEAPPAECPICHVPASKFTKQEV